MPTLVCLSALLEWPGVALAAPAVAVNDGHEAAVHCEIVQAPTRLRHDAEVDVRVRAPSAVYRCTQLPAGRYAYLCAGPVDEQARAHAEGGATLRYRMLDMYGLPLAEGALLRAFRVPASGAVESMAPLFRWGVVARQRLPAGAYRAMPLQPVRLVLDDAFEPRSACRSGNSALQLAVALPLEVEVVSGCEARWASTLAFGRAPPSWDLPPDPATRVQLDCRGVVAWAVLLSDGEQPNEASVSPAHGAQALRRRMRGPASADPMLHYGVRVGARGEADFAQAGGVDEAGGRVLLRGYVPGDPKATSLSGHTDTLILTLLF